MSLLSKLERRFGWMAIHHLTVIIVIGQACAYLLLLTHPGSHDDPTSSMLFHIVFIPVLAVHGEVWRFVTFVFIPPSMDILWMAIGLYFFYFVGQVVEANWGAFRYNLFLLIAYAMTVAVSFIQPMLPVTNAFLFGSVFFAFAFLYPDVVIYAFLILPIKAKWLGIAAGLFYVYLFIDGDLQTKLLIGASVVNFFLFFASDIIYHIRSGHRRLKNQAAKVQQRDQAFHTCAVCGITDKTNPKMDFRYCPLCVGSWGYCSEHLLHHEHKTQPPSQ